jgi:hypothetical protein
MYTKTVESPDPAASICLKLKTEIIILNHLP